MATRDVLEDMNKQNAKLPAHVVEQLRDTRDTDHTEFQALVLALRNRRWPLRAIGEPFGVTRVAVKSWVVRAEANSEAVELSKTLSVPRHNTVFVYEDGSIDYTMPAVREVKLTRREFILFERVPMHLRNDVLDELEA